MYSIGLVEIIASTREIEGESVGVLVKLAVKGQLVKLEQLEIWKERANGRDRV